jgi:hypothetical protein
MNLCFDRYNMAEQQELETFIITKSKQLAKRYRNAQMYEDLQQEAILVGYEMLNQGITCKAKIAGYMRTKLHDFYNFGQMPVYLPASGYSRKARADLLSGVGSQTLEWPLLCALLSSKGGDTLEESQVYGSNDHVAEYEQSDYLQHLMFLMEEYLDNREYYVVTSVYLREEDQQVVADDLGITQQRVGQILETALEKIRVKLNVTKIGGTNVYP